MLAVIKALQYWYIELKGIVDTIKVIIDYKALEYFISSKLLSARQAC